MGLFNNDSLREFKEKGYSIICYGETPSTAYMTQFILFYRINNKIKTEIMAKFEGFYYELINDDLYQRGLIPLSIKTLDDNTDHKHFQVIVRRANS